MGGCVLIRGPVAKICDVAFTVRFVIVRRRKPSLRLGPPLLSFRRRFKKGPRREDERMAIGRSVGRRQAGADADVLRTNKRRLPTTDGRGPKSNPFFASIIRMEVRRHGRLFERGDRYSTAGAYLVPVIAANAMLRLTSFRKNARGAYKTKSSPQSRLSSRLFISFIPRPLRSFCNCVIARNHVLMTHACRASEHLCLRCALCRACITSCKRPHHFIHYLYSDS